MKYKTLFRLMVKAVGVWIFCTSLGYLCSTVVRVIFGGIGRSPVSGMYESSYVTGYLLQALLGLYLFFGGKWVVDQAIPSNRPYCHECGYDLTGAVGDVCNECGTPFRGPATPANSL